MVNPTYQISRNGKQIGTFNAVQVQQMCSSGVLLPTDHAWTEGMKDWQSLAVLFPALLPPASSSPDKAVVRSAASSPHGCLALIVPIGRSGMAIVAGYLGLLSPCILPAPFAILFGILAIKHINKNPELSGLGRAWFGIIMGALSLLGFIVFGLLI